MSAEMVESVDGSLRDDAEPGPPQLELVPAAFPRRSFDEAMAYYRDSVASYRPDNDRWRTDYHREDEEADWVYEHRDALRSRLAQTVEVIIPPEAA